MRPWRSCIWAPSLAHAVQALHPLKQQFRVQGHTLTPQAPTRKALVPYIVGTRKVRDRGVVTLGCLRTFDIESGRIGAPRREAMLRLCDMTLLRSLSLPICT